MTVHAPDADDARQTPGPARTTQTLVVGYDGSDESHAALGAAIQRAGADDMIGVVYAYPAVSSWMGHPFHDQAVRKTQYDGRRILERAAIAAEDSAAEISLEMHEGQPAEVLGRIASLRGADEIVIGTRGLGRLRAALGSVSQELLRKADRPVLVVPASNPA